MNYYVLIPDRKQAFQCDSFNEAYKLAYGKQRKYKEGKMYVTSN